MNCATPGCDQAAVQNLRICRGCIRDCTQDVAWRSQAPDWEAVDITDLDIDRWLERLAPRPLARDVREMYHYPYELCFCCGHSRSAHDVAAPGTDNWRYCYDCGPNPTPPATAGHVFRPR